MRSWHPCLLLRSADDDGGSAVKGVIGDPEDGEGDEGEDGFSAEAVYRGMSDKGAKKVEGEAGISPFLPAAAYLWEDEQDAAQYFEEGELDAEVVGETEVCDALFGERCVK